MIGKFHRYMVYTNGIQYDINYAIYYFFFFFYETIYYFFFPWAGHKICVDRIDVLSLNLKESRLCNKFYLG